MPNPFQYFFPGFKKRIGIPHHTVAMTCLLASFLPFLYFLVLVNHIQERYSVSVRACPFP